MTLPATPLQPYPTENNTFMYPRNDEYHLGLTNNVDNVIHTYRSNTTLDFGAAGPGT
jgi:hypothetical protein